MCVLVSLEGAIWCHAGFIPSDLMVTTSLVSMTLLLNPEGIEHIFLNLTRTCHDLFAVFTYISTTDNWASKCASVHLRYMPSLFTDTRRWTNHQTNFRHSLPVNPTVQYYCK